MQEEWNLLAQGFGSSLPIFTSLHRLVSKLNIHKSIRIGIIVHRAIRPVRWFFSCCNDLIPLHRCRVVSPQVIHIIRI